MDNVIAITLNDKEHIHRIEFDSSPTVSELVAIGLIIKEVLEHNFDTQSIYNVLAPTYGRLTDVEETIRGKMTKEIICGDFQDFVSKLYEAIENAAKENTGIQFALSPEDCKKWAAEHVSWIEIY